MIPPPPRLFLKQSLYLVCVARKVYWCERVFGMLEGFDKQYGSATQEKRLADKEAHCFLVNIQARDTIDSVMRILPTA